jgi:hypothetical protein
MEEFDEEKAQRGLEKLKAAFIECNRIEYEKTKKRIILCRKYRAKREV